MVTEKICSSLLIKAEVVWRQANFLLAVLYVVPNWTRICFYLLHLMSELRNMPNLCSEGSLYTGWLTFECGIQAVRRRMR